MGMRRATIAAVVVALAALLASSALAGNSSSTRSTYTSKGKNVQQTLGGKQTGTKKKPVAKVTGSTTLPFTGLDLAFVVGAGLVLVGTGLSLRRITRKPPVAS
jgi:hypothetical protein